MMDKEKYGFYPWLKWTFNLCDFLGNSLPAAFIIGLVACITIPLHIIELPFYYAKKYTTETDNAPLAILVGLFWVPLLVTWGLVGLIIKGETYFDEPSNRLHPPGARRRVEERLNNTTRQYFHDFKVGDRVILDGQTGTVVGFDSLIYANDGIKFKLDDGDRVIVLPHSFLNKIEKLKPLEIKQVVKKHDFR